MFKFLFLFCLFFWTFFPVYGFSKPPKDQSVKIVIPYDQDLQDQIKFLDSKVDFLQQTTEKDFNSERQNYNVNVVVLCTIVAFVLAMMAATWWYNFRIAREQLQNEFEENRKKVNVDVTAITQKVIADTDEKLDSLEKNFKRKISLANAYSYDSVGRIYEKDSSPALSCSWFMRAVDEYIKAGNGLDKWCSIRLDWIIVSLKKPDLIGWPKDVKKEMDSIIERLPNKDLDVKIKEIKGLMDKVKTF